MDSVIEAGVQSTLSRPTAQSHMGDLGGVDSALWQPLAPTKTPLLTGDSVQGKRDELRRYFHQTWELYKRLFELIRVEAAYYERHEPLRHPLIFYFAHPAVFYVNKLIAGHYISKRVDPGMESMMAVGVDEMSWDDLNMLNYDWPTVDAVRSYRAAVRALVDSFIQSMPLELPICQNTPAWIILMGIEHERIHLETSSVILRQMPVQALCQGDELSAPQRKLWALCEQRGQAPANAWVPVAAQHIRLGKLESDATYGWDNEYGVENIEVDGFEASRMLVSNAEFMEFVQAGAYTQASWWTPEGQSWLAYTQATHPRFWTLRDGTYFQRQLLEETELPLNWPVEVNCLEAQAFCAWKAQQIGRRVQLPTEAQWTALRETLDTDQPYWSVAPGNVNLEHGASSVPVDRFRQGDFFDIIGNVWQWTRTPIMPFHGFQVHPLYDDFSLPTFDGRHNLIKGGSWISTGNETLKSARYAFRRHFYQHAGFRMVIDESDSEAVTAGSRIYETDTAVTQYLDFHYATERLGVANFPKACVELVIPHVAPMQRARCLDIGCSVGRASFEFARYFAQVDAIDFSARFIQSAVRLQQGGQAHFEIPTEGELTQSQSVALERLGLDRHASRVAFVQGDACNLKPQFTDYDLVFAGNLIDRLYDPALFLQQITRRMRSGAVLALSSPYTWLEEYTQKARWLGGRRENGEPLTTFAGLERALTDTCQLIARHDVPFVIRETARKHQHTIAEMTLWRKL